MKIQEKLENKRNRNALAVATIAAVALIIAAIIPLFKNASSPSKKVEIKTNHSSPVSGDIQTQNNYFLNGSSDSNKRAKMAAPTESNGKEERTFKLFATNAGHTETKISSDNMTGSVKAVTIDTSLKEGSEFKGELSLYSIFGNAYQYNGEIKNGRANGHGIATFKDKFKQEGFFKDNLRNGNFSVSDSLNKYLCSAIYRNDSLLRVSGLEVYFSNHHGFYDGEVSLNLQPNGQGRIQFDTGYFVGHIEYGILREGKALFFVWNAKKYKDYVPPEDYPQPTYYEGQVFGFEPNGQGILRYQDGSYYDGTFEHGLFNGEGTLFFDGVVTKGRWDHGVLKDNISDK